MNSSTARPERPKITSVWTQKKKLKRAAVWCFQTVCFSGWFCETLLRSCLFPTRLQEAAARSGVDCENDQPRFVFLSFLDRERHRGAWVRWSICWNGGGTERQCSAYSVQLKYHNHSSHSEYCLILPFHWTGNTTLKSVLRPWEFPVLFSWLCWTGFFFLPRMLLKGRMFKERRTTKKSWQETWL